MSKTKVWAGGPACLLAVLFLVLGVNTSAQSRTEKAKKLAPAQPTAETPAAPTDDREDPQFKGMEYRLIGPFRGGRSLTASGIPGDPTTYYFGATGGGVWKSADGGMSW